MPEYIAVRCFNTPCELFQVIQKPKSNKWECRVCHSKQSVRKIYASSYKASDIRPVITKLNYEVGMKKEFTPVKEKPQITQQIGSDDADVTEEPTPKTSKWAQYPY